MTMQLSLFNRRNIASEEASFHPIKEHQDAIACGRLLRKVHASPHCKANLAFGLDARFFFRSELDLSQCIESLRKKIANSILISFALFCEWVDRSENLPQCTQEYPCRGTGKAPCIHRYSWRSRQYCPTTWPVSCPNAEA